MKINLLTHDNGVGLTQDVKIIRKILKGYDCEFIDLRTGSPTRCDINIFFEHISPKYYSFAKVNLFFPNPEWFEWPHMLRGLDLVLCKTHDCQRIFDTIKSEKDTWQTVYTSFTSEDRNTGQRAEEIVYLHTAGQSTAKGTDTVFKAWKEDYPILILTKLRDFKYYQRKQDNILTCFERVPLDILKELQNKCTFGVCPSEYEGFGHYIWEGKSCGQIIITTDAPPMNEMVTTDNGFLIPSGRSRRFNFGRLHSIDPIPFQGVIEKTMLLTPKEISKMRLASRKSWEENDKLFKETFLQIIKDYAEKIREGFKESRKEVEAKR
jgi:hypothetical protein